MDSFSAYPFENYLQIIKNIVCKSAKPLQQIVKRLSELEMTCLVEPYMENQNLMVLEDIHFSGLIIPNMRTEKQFKKTKLKTRILSSKMPDNCVYLYDKSIIIIGRNCEAYDDLYLLPVKSRQLGIHVVNN